MAYQRYIIDSSNSYHLFRSADCNLSNPVDYFQRTMQEHNYDFAMSAIRAHPSYLTVSTRSRMELSQRFKWKARQDWKLEYARLVNLKLSGGVYLLLLERKKKAQQRLLKGVAFNTDMLLSIPLQAWIANKMPYSRFVFEYHAKELAGKIYPAMLYMKEDGKFDYVGITDLSPSEMRVALEKKHRVICDFIGDEEFWHCFFRTEAGIKGNEAPHIGEPHLHYISSAWGLSRNQVLENLSSYRYKLRAETIIFKPKSRD